MDEILFREFREVESRHWWFVARREILLAVLRRALPRGARLLDVGCGTGFLLERAREFLDVHGVDVSPIGLAMCRERGVTQVREGSAYDLASVADETFDCVGLFDVIEHLDDDVAALRNVSTVLRPGGRALVTVPAFQALWSEHDVVNQHRRRYTRAQLAAALRASGFEIEKLTYFNARLFPLAVASRVVGRALRRRPGGELSVPPAAVNALLTRIFAGERDTVLAAGPGGGYRAGLSVLALARVA